jgi:tight adherence protein B
MTPVMLMALTGLAGTLTILGIYSLVTDMLYGDKARLSRRVDEEFRKGQRDRLRKSSLFKNLEEIAGETASTLQKTRISWTQQFIASVEQSGLNWGVRGLLLRMAVVGFLCAMGGLLIRQNVLIGVALGIAGSILPLAFMYWKRRARMRKLLNQMPDALDLMARIIRAGQTMTQGLQAVGDEFEQPIGGEFTFCYEQQNLGLPHDLALRDLGERSGLLEMKILVLALLVHQQAGGNLSQLLESLAQVIRERLRMQGKIQALTAEGRLQAMVLLALPPLVFAAMLVLNREYAQKLLDHPNLLIGTVGVMALGAFWIRRIIRFDF